MATTLAERGAEPNPGSAPPPITSKRDHISRAEGWRRRGPLLPAMIFMIVATQIPFIVTLYYSTQSWNLVRPGSREFNGLNNYVDVFTDSQFRHSRVEHGGHDRGDSHPLGTARTVLRNPARPQVHRPQRRPHPADHPISAHPGRGRTAVEDQPALPHQRPGQLGPEPLRRRGHRLAQQVPPGRA